MEHKLVYSAPANVFEEALPIGNGTVGATVYGRFDREKISLNHDTLWSGKPRRVTRPQAYEAYKKGQQLVLEDRIEEATPLLEQDFTADFSQSYLPLGNLYVSSLYTGEVAEYRRELDIAHGIVSVRYQQNGIHFVREYFVSHPDNCFVLHIKSDAPADYAFSADCQLKSAVTAWKDRLYLTGECPSCIAPQYFRERVPTVYDGEGIKFAAIGACRTDGNVSQRNETVTVEGATEITFVLCIETSYIDFDTLPSKAYYAPCEERLTKLMERSFGELRERHIADHTSLYDRVKLDLGFAPSDRMTDERIRAANENPEADLGIFELLCNFGRYLVIASSREGSQATNLQGIWNELLYAPWSSNYTVNINTQMNYWPVLMNNLDSCNLPLVELIRKISITGADAAKEFYNAKGYCCHHNVDLWGLTTPVGAQRVGCLQYAYWNVAAGWLCRHVWEHYEYTMDKDFLRDTAYPLMKGAAEFFLDVMVKDGERYIVTPATSPENKYIHNGTAVALARHSAMSQAIVTDLFENLSKSAEILEINDDFIKEIREKLPLLNTYQIGSEGQLLEFDSDYPEADIHHRHVSHMYGLYPAESISMRTTPALAEACRVTLERRGDVSTGWGMVWRSCLWSRLGEGDRALELLKQQLHLVNPADGSKGAGGTYPNLLDACPPFQIDGNYGVCAAFTLMLMQSERGRIHLLPALPTAFKNGSVRGLKAKGNITVDIAWKDNALLSYTLTTPLAQTVIVCTPTGEQTVTLEAEKPFVFESK